MKTSSGFWNCNPHTAKVGKWVAVEAKWNWMRQCLPNGFWVGQRKRPNPSGCEIIVDLVTFFFVWKIGRGRCRTGEEEGSRCYLSGFEVFHAASHLVSERDEILVGEDVARFHFMAGKLDGMFVRRISQLPYWTETDRHHEFNASFQTQSNTNTNSNTNSNSSSRSNISSSTTSNTSSSTSSSVGK